MSDFATPLVSGLIGLVVSGAGTYFGIHWKIRKDLEAKYDESLRGLRIEAYRDLWKLTKTLAAFGREANPTLGELGQLSLALRDWYFDRGGLYLSEETRDACFCLQRTLRAVSISHRWADANFQGLDDETFNRLREIASRLRSRMTYDVGTRRPFSLQQKKELAKDWQPTQPLAPSGNATPEEIWIFEHWLGPSRSLGGQ